MTTISEVNIILLLKNLINNKTNMKVSHVHDKFNEELMFVLVFPVRNMFYCSYFFFKPNIGREFSVSLLVNEYCNVASERFLYL